MFGITRRDIYAFGIGNAALGLVMGYVLHASGIFLFNAVFLAYDLYWFIDELNRIKSEDPE